MKNELAWLIVFIMDLICLLMITFIVVLSPIEINELQHTGLMLIYVAGAVGNYAYGMFRGKNI